MSLHSDLFLVSLLVDSLKGNKKVVLLVFRENFAHYSALAKKLGANLEQFVSNDQLKHVECFLTSWAVDLPMTEVSPATYVLPSNKVLHISSQALFLESLPKIDFSNRDVVFVDCLNFLKALPEIIYAIHEKAVEADVQLVIGGQREGSLLTSIFERESDVRIIL